MRRILVLLTALAAAVAVLPSQAAALGVDVLDFRFEPRALQASAGDTVTWTWHEGQPHNVVAYAGDSFGSPTQRIGTYSAPFGGGTVLYRCTLHSTIDQGPCNGMCGIVSDDAEPPPAPSMTLPTPGSTVGSPTRIGGTALDAATVVVREGSTQRGEAIVDLDGSWSIDLALSDGTHTLHAISRSSIGIDSQPSPAITFTVDATPPQVTLESPGALTITGDPVAASGTATDDRLLASVTLELTDLLLGGTSATTATIAPDGTWSALVDAPHPGPHSLVARAVDAVGNTTSTEPVTIIVGPNT